MRNMKFYKYGDVHDMIKETEEYIANNDIGIISTMPDDYFEKIEYQTEGIRKNKFGYKNGFPYYISSETDIEAMQKAKIEGRYQSMYPETGATIGDVAAATPEVLTNVPKGLAIGIDNAFKLIDSVTGGAVTEVDNFLSENFPNTLGKKIEYKTPEGVAETTGTIIGQYVIPGAGVYKMARGAILLAEPLTVGLFSSKDEGNLANVIEDMFPDFTKSSELSKTIIEGLSVDGDDTEVMARAKNIVADAAPFVVVEKFYKILKGLKQNPEALEELKSVGAAATPTEAPTTPIAMQGDTNLVKTNIPEEDLALSSYDRISFDESLERPFKVFLKGQESHQRSFTTQQEAEDFINEDIVKNKKIEEQNNLIRSKSDKPFYSNVEKAISNMTMNSGRGDQILATIKNTSGVKQSEIEDLGLDQFLAGKEKVTMEELNDFIADKSLITRVNDIILDNQLPTSTFGSSTSTRFGQSDLVTPGGTNYKEMLITVPGTPQVFTDHHYKGNVPGGENLIAHTRFNERVIDGKKTLFVEEIQSDLHQAGRKKGYVSADRLEVDEQLASLRKEAEPLYNRYKDIQEKSFYSQSDAPTFGQATKVDIIDGSNGKIVKTYELTGNQTEQSNIVLRAAAEADDMNRAAGVNKVLGDLRVKLNDIENKIDDLKEFGKVPDAPFKKNWHELTTKRLIKYAIDNGFDAIAFTTGKMQNKRYNLSEKITALRAEKIIGGTKDGQYELTATPKYGEQVTKVVPENELERFVGKDLTTKIVEDAPNYKDGRTYTGLDLEFGGDGMEGFYDKMLPSFLTKFGKKYGANLEKTVLDTSEKTSYKMKDISDFKFNNVYDAIGKSGDTYASYKIIQNFDNRPGERIEVIQIKDGKETVIHRTFELNEAKEILLEEIDGFTVPQIQKKEEGYQVPFMIFTPEMKKEILQEGVPIAQLEDREQEQQTAVV